MPKDEVKAVLFLFHGNGDDGPGFCTTVGADSLAVSNGVVSVCPSAVGGAWSTSPEAERAYIEAIMEVVDRHVDASAPRLGLGFESGADVSFRLVCESELAFEVLGAVGTGWPQDPAKVAGCLPRSSFSFWYAMGTADPLFPDSHANFDGWRAFSTGPLRERGFPIPDDVAPGIRRWTKGLFPLSAYVEYLGLGHTWPGRDSQLDAATAFLDFAAIRP